MNLLHTLNEISHEPIIFNIPRYGTIVLPSQQNRVENTKFENEFFLNRT